MSESENQSKTDMHWNRVVNREWHKYLAANPKANYPGWLKSELVKALRLQRRNFGIRCTIHQNHDKQI